MLDLLERIAELESVLASKDARITSLEAQVAELNERLGQNSSNSHKPPSSDGPGQRGDASKSSSDKKRKRSGKKRGGQKGHRGSRRELLPPEHVDVFSDHYPTSCSECFANLRETFDNNATRYQVTEIPPIKPHVTEYRLHKVGCVCGHETRASMDHVPHSSFGPRLTSIVGLLSGVYHLSRRKTKTLLSEVFDVSISLGGLSGIESRVSDAIAPAANECVAALEQSEVTHTDATSWLCQSLTVSLWTLATAAVTVFKILANGKTATIKPMFEALKGILVSDRATVFGFWAMDKRQICWAHLLRKFVSFSERDGPAKDIGVELLDLTGIMFAYWHDFKDGTCSRARLRERMAPVLALFETLLEKAVSSDIKRLSGSCADMLGHKDALWTFIDEEGVEPTNNHAERELRAFVLWRKRSFGSQSERGNRFAERIMTVAHTARKQNKNLLEYLTSACHAYMEGHDAPIFLDKTIAA